MLIFEKEVQDNPTYYYRSTAESEKAFSADMIQLWVEVLKRIQENRPDGSWNRVIFEIWTTEGHLEAYPQKRGKESPDAKKPCIVVDLDILKATVEKSQKTQDEDELESIIALAYISVREPIQRMYRKEPALTELKRVLETNDFTVWTMKDDDRETLMEIEIFF